MRELAPPYVEPVPQRLRAWRDGRLLVDSRRAHLYFPDARHARWAVPAEDLDPAVASAATDRHEGLIVLDPDAADIWVEEDQQAYGSPRSPRHRVDAVRSCRHVQIVVDDRPVADTLRPVLRIETDVVPRWYVPPGDVSWELFETDAARTICQYKGEATYFRVRGTDVRAWTYRYPEAGVAVIAGHLAIAGDEPGVDIVVDGELERRG